MALDPDAVSPRGAEGRTAADLMLPVVHHPACDATSAPDSHRFPMRTFALLADMLRASPFAAQLEWQPQPAPLADSGSGFSKETVWRDA